MTSPKSSRGHLARAVAFTGLAATATGVIAPAAMAAPSAPSGTWHLINSKYPSGESTVANEYTAAGYVTGADGKVYYCAEDHQHAAQAGESATFNAPKFITGAYTGTEASLSATNLQKLAYVINKYGNPTSGSAQDKADQITAVDYLNGVLANNTSNHPLTWGSAALPDATKIKALADSYLAEADKYYGTQKVTVNGPTGGKVGETGKASFTVTANGNNVAGESYTEIGRAHV